MKYQIQKGDNLIKIARKFGLNSLDEILDMNPQIKDPNLIYNGQIINLPDKEYQDSLPVAIVTAEMPAEAKRKKVSAYAQAVRDHKMNINQVPEQYRSDAYKESIRQTTEEAAPVVLSKVMLAPMTIPDVLIRGGLNEARKAVTPKDKLRDDEYGIGDYFSGNFSWLGKNFEEKHPVTDFIINATTTPIVMVGGEKVLADAIDYGPQLLSRVATNARNNAVSTARAAGIRRMAPAETSRGTLSAEEWQTIMNANRSGKFSTDVSTMSGKGTGKTGTVRAGAKGGYRGNSSTKGTIGHKATGTPKTQKVVLGSDQVAVADAIGGYNPWHGAMVPIVSAPRTSYVVVPPDVQEHYDASWENKNPMIWNTKPTVVVPYKYGNENITHNEGKAAKTGAKREVITKEGLKENIPGRSRTQEVIIVPGNWPYTTPSDWYIENGMTVVKKNGGILKRTK